MAVQVDHHGPGYILHSPQRLVGDQPDRTAAGSLHLFEGGGKRGIILRPHLYQACPRLHIETIVMIGLYHDAGQCLRDCHGTG